ncbi:MAG: PilW family protein [Comamonas sp.]
MNVSTTFRTTGPRALRRQHKLQHGLTLIELLVAMVLGLLIALAAAAALVVARQGFSNVDAASQLRDNGRFAQDVLQRVGVQVGFKSLQYAATTRPSNTDGVLANPPPHVFGLNNASRTSGDTWDDGSARTSGSVGYGSDILVLRYQTSMSTKDATAPDGTVIDCMGIAPTAIPTARDDRLISILHVAVGVDGEPALMCSRSATGAAPYDTQPLVSGVENFQVLYGVDGVAPGNTTTPITTAADSVPERYLRADQLTVDGNDTATYANWQRVRSLRIGLVLRGPPGSALDRSSQTFYPLGSAKGSASGTTGSAFSSTNDPNTVFTPAIDGRLRQTVTFTVHLRNFQEDI